MKPGYWFSLPVTLFLLFLLGLDIEWLVRQAGGAQEVVQEHIGLAGSLWRMHGKGERRSV
jgi:hypothetical protein